MKQNLTTKPLAQQQLSLAKLANCQGITSSDIHKILNQIETLTELANLSEQELSQIIKPEKAQRLHRYWQQMTDDRFSSLLEKHGVWYVTIFDTRFPSLLKESQYSLYVLFGRGNKEILNQPCLAVVGSRKPSDYGARACRHLTQALVSHDLTIVSGLAFGVDGVAHKTTLEKEGTTIAVLGHGLDSVQPRSHTRLAERIISNGGTLLSEYGIGTPALRQHYPARNRLIAGLSLATLVIEGTTRSGSLITADFTRSLERPLLALPGSIFNQMAEGPHRLIRKGATLVTHVQDILDKLPRNLGTKKHIDAETLLSLDPEQQQIIKLISTQDQSIDDLAREMKINVSDISHHVTVLELTGLVEVNKGLVQRIR